MVRPKDVRGLAKDQANVNRAVSDRVSRNVEIVPLDPKMTCRYFYGAFGLLGFFVEHDIVFKTNDSFDDVIGWVCKKINIFALPQCENLTNFLPLRFYVKSFFDDFSLKNSYFNHFRGSEC